MTSIKYYLDRTDELLVEVMRRRKDLTAYKPEDYELDTVLRKMLGAKPRPEGRMPYEGLISPAPKEPIGKSELLKHTHGRHYVTCYWKGGKRDSAGFRVYWMQLRDPNGKLIDEIDCRSGTRSANQKSRVHPKNDWAGSGNPLPEAIYDIGRLIYTGYNEPGVGYIKVPLEYAKVCRGINNRGELLVHADERYPGSMGCMCPYKHQDNNNDGLYDIKTFAKWHKDYRLEGCKFFCWHNTGYLRDEFEITLEDLQGKSQGFQRWASCLSSTSKAAI